MMLDLIGTCHSELQKPATLKPEHLVLYELHWYRGQDIVSDMKQDHNVHLDQEGVICPPEEVKCKRLPNVTSKGHSLGLLLSSQIFLCVIF